MFKKILLKNVNKRLTSGDFMDLYQVKLYKAGEPERLCVDARKKTTDTYGGPMAWPRGELDAEKMFCVDGWPSFLEYKNVSPVNPDGDGVDLQEFYQRLDAFYREHFSPVHVIEQEPTIDEQAGAMLKWRMKEANRTARTSLRKPCWRTIRNKGPYRYNG